MRVLRRYRWALFLAGAFLFSLLALLPLRLALDRFGFDDRGLTARAATGSLWSGALQEAQIGPVPLGDLGARLHVLPLFLGRARLSLHSAEPGGFAGAVVVTRHSFGFDDVSARLRVGALFAPLAVPTLDFDDLSGVFTSGRCTHAGGRIRAALSGAAGNAGLEGQARCAGDALLLPLASPSGTERLNIRLFADGRYQAEALVRPADPAVRGALVAAGFRTVGSGLGMRVDGAF
jgi:general secretion pathway protein N